MSVRVFVSSKISPSPLSAETIVSEFVLRSRFSVFRRFWYFVYVRVCRLKVRQWRVVGLEVEAGVEAAKEGCCFGLLRQLEAEAVVA